jgi:hypothetical protein
MQDLAHASYTADDVWEHECAACSKMTGYPTYRPHRRTEVQRWFRSVEQWECVICSATAQPQRRDVFTTMTPFI